MNLTQARRHYTHEEFQVYRAATLRRDLQWAGIEGPALQLALRRDAVKRHQQRVEFAKAAAARYIESVAPGLDADHWMAAVWAIFEADRLGVGGSEANPAGLGCGTARHPAFANAGKGRKLATDGGAWDVAIAQAQREVRSLYPAMRGAAWCVEQVDGQFVIGVELTIDTGEDDGPEPYSYDVSAVVPDAWARAIAARKLMTAPIADSLRPWGELYNHLFAEAEARRAEWEAEQDAQAAARGSCWGVQAVAV